VIFSTEEADMIILYSCASGLIIGLGIAYIIDRKEVWFGVSHIIGGVCLLIATILISVYHSGG
jgi:hypothetical protein